MGVEEEFLLVRADGRLSRYGPELADATTDAHGGLEVELKRCQVEAVTGICRTPQEVLGQLRGLRGGLAEVAGPRGLRLLPSGCPIVPETAPQEITPNPRYLRMAEWFGATARSVATCGCHVHVGIQDRETGVAVSNQLRPWLPVLLTLTANSPFDGTDTGYASWRYLVWARWPTAGPPPVFESAEQYEHAVRSLLQAGAALDRAMAYWDIRLSQQHPTIELRVCDVAATADEAVLIAALTRAMVATALEETRPPLTMPQHLLKAASWRAARDGLGGSCVNPVTGHTLPTPVLVRQLIGRVRPALAEAGDLDLVLDLLESLVAKGCGAARQRRAFARNGKLTDVVDLLTAQTAGAEDLV